MNQTRGQIKTLTGTVVSNKMEKTIVVNVTRKYKHPKYGKYINVNKKYYAHDEKNEAVIGDEVMIGFSRPISKTKKWRLLKVTRKVVEV
jgi:small subunit ribosomal protein S17